MTKRDRPTVLLVEDDRAAREMFEYALRMAGFTVLAARDGLAALRTLEQDLPDAIALDLDLPWVSGIDVQQEVVAHAETSSIPIVIVTGTDWKPTSPVYATLRKPISGETLVKVVQEALGGSNTGGRDKPQRRSRL
jgi:DNA-binding response OmpR family regulator